MVLKVGGYGIYLNSWNFQFKPEKESFPKALSSVVEAVHESRVEERTGPITSAFTLMASITSLQRGSQD